MGIDEISAAGLEIHNVRALPAPDAPSVSVTVKRGHFHTEIGTFIPPASVMPNPTHPAAVACIAALQKTTSGNTETKTAPQSRFGSDRPRSSISAGNRCQVAAIE
eukprot:1988994-Rhodomonas_salina.2